MLGIVLRAWQIFKRGLVIVCDADEQGNFFWLIVGHASEADDRQDSNKPAHVKSPCKLERISRSYYSVSVKNAQVLQKMRQI